MDTVEGLGEFVEFEVSINECDLIEDGEKTANELMHKLGIQEKDLLTGAYADHLMSKLASLFESGVENMFSVQFSDITNQLLAKKLEIGFTVKPVYFNSIVFIFKENVDFHSYIFYSVFHLLKLFFEQLFNLRKLNSSNSKKFSLKTFFFI